MSTPTSDLSGLVARLERLERQNRRLKAVSTAVVIVLEAGLLMAAQAE